MSVFAFLFVFFFCCFHSLQKTLNLLKYQLVKSHILFILKMYASGEEDDGSTNRRCHHNLTTRKVQKCFILTPSFHYINPAFPQISSDESSYHMTPLSSPAKSLPACGFHFSSEDGWGEDVFSPSSISMSNSSPSSSSIFLPSPVNLWSEQITPETLTCPLEEQRESTPQSSSSSSGIGISPDRMNNVDYHYTPAPCSIQPASSRCDMSLGVLTRRFVQLMIEKPTKSVDLKQASIDLGVKRRRLYDVTTILEGLGLISKHGKQYVYGAVDNSIGYERKLGRNGSIVRDLSTAKSSEAGSSLLSYHQAIRQEIDDLQELEYQLDSFIDFLTRQVELLRNGSDLSPNKQNKAYSSSATNRDSSAYLYVCYDDIGSVPGFTSDIIIGIRSPAGTSLEVPDPDHVEIPGMRRYQINLTSKSQSTSPGGYSAIRADPINIHLIRPRAPFGHKSKPRGQLACDGEKFLHSHYNSKECSPSEFHSYHNHQSSNQLEYHESADVHHDRVSLDCDDTSQWSTKTRKRSYVEMNPQSHQFPSQRLSKRY